jgi:hypothetical protein
MQVSNILRRPVPSLRDLTAAWLGSRRALVVTGIAIVIAGLALGWHWLSAIGVAPVILSLAPCAAMCALGACAMMKGSSSCAKPGSAKDAGLPNDGSTSARLGELDKREPL